MTGAAPHSAAACSALSTRSRIGPTSASSWARLMVPTLGSDASSLARGWLAMRVVIAASSSEGEVWGGRIGEAILMGVVQ